MKTQNTNAPFSLTSDIAAITRLRPHITLHFGGIHTAMVGSSFTPPRICTSYRWNLYVRIAARFSNFPARHILLKRAVPLFLRNREATLVPEISLPGEG